jgi:hypothetical protein
MFLIYCSFLLESFYADGSSVLDFRVLIPSTNHMPDILWRAIRKFLTSPRTKICMGSDVKNCQQLYFSLKSIKINTLSDC